jgi:hypothetical protein
MTVLDAPAPADRVALLAAQAAERQCDTWLTATIRPAGSFGRQDAERLGTLLDALSSCASIIVLDLRSAHLRSPRAAEVVDGAAGLLEARGGCLVCVHADAETRAQLAGAGPHAVVLDGEPDEALCGGVKLERGW